MNPRPLLLALLLLALAGCRTVVEAPAGEVDRRAVYQQIADALPEATFDWGSPPGIVEMSASARAEGPAPEPMPLLATERGFRLRYQVYRTHTIWVPYRALREVSTSWEPFPNVLFCLLPVLPLQSVHELLRDLQP